MNSVEYEIGRQYRHERQNEAEAYRLARHASDTRQSRVRNNVPHPQVWIGAVVAFFQPKPRHLTSANQWIEQ